MSSTKLAPVIASYVVAANAQNVDAVTACFAEDAVVLDEKQEWRGVSAIRNWATEVSAKYHPALEILEAANFGNTTVLAGRVSGDFPNSPIELRYAFALDGGKIQRLEIT